MAYDIGPRIGIDGEAGFRKQIRTINADMASLRSEMEKNSVAFGTNEKTQESLTQKSKLLSKAVEEQQRKVKECSDVLVKSTEKFGDADEKTAKWRATVTKAETELLKLEAQLNATNKELDFTTSSMGKFQTEMDTASQKLTSFGDGAQKIGGKLTTNITLPLATAGAMAVKAAIDYESAFAGVRKTVNATEEELKKMSEGIVEMSQRMPESAVEIAGVAEAAGQLGIQTGSIIGFTEVMVMLGDTTNISSNEAATALARFANVTQMSQGDFDRLGSSVVALGNTCATTEAEIVNMGQNIASAGYQVGMSEADIMAYAAAMSSVGIEAEAGGTAVSKLMIEIQLATEKGGAQLDNFAIVAGMSAGEFVQAFEKDAGRAVASFITGLSDTERTGKSAIGMLDEMGISEVRLRNAVLSLTSSGDLLNNTMNTSEKAWESNTALQKEAATRYETTASKLKILWNQAVAVAIEFGEEMLPVLEDVMESVSGLVKWFGSLTDEQKKVAVQTGATAAAAGPLISGLGKVSSGIGAITKQLGTGGALAKLTDLTKKMTTIGVVSSTSAVSIGGFGGGIAALAPIALPAIAVLGITAAVITNMKDSAGRAAEKLKDVSEKTDAVTQANQAVIDKVKETKKVFDDQAMTIEINAVQANELATVLFDVVQREGETASGKERILTMVQALNELVPNLNLAYDGTTNSLSFTNEKILDSIKNMEEQAKAVANQELLTQTYRDQIKAQMELATNKKQLDEVQGRLNEKEAEYNRQLEEQSGLLPKFTFQFSDLGNEVKNLKGQKEELTGKTKELQSVWVDSETTIEEYSRMLNGAGDAVVFVGDKSILTADQLKIYEQAIKEGKGENEAFDTAIRNVGKTMKEVADESEKYGKDTIDGYHYGVRSGEKNEETANKTWRGLISLWRNDLEINSPSKLTGGFGKDTYDGFRLAMEAGDWRGIGISSIGSFITGMFSKKGDANKQGQEIGEAANDGASSLLGNFGESGGNAGENYSSGVRGQSSNAQSAGDFLGSQGNAGVYSWIPTFGQTGDIGGERFGAAIRGRGGYSRDQASYAASMGNEGFIGGINAWTIVENIVAAADKIWKGFCEALGINSPSVLFKQAAQFCLEGFAEKFTPTNWTSLAKKGAQAVYDAFSGGGLSITKLFEALGGKIAGNKGFTDFLRDQLGLDASGLLGALNGILFPGGGSTGSGSYIGPSGLQWPSDTTDITDYFGDRESPGGIGSTYHQGVDIGAPYGSPVYAAGDGSASIAGWNGGYGNTVKLDHGNGLATMYAHMSEVLTSVGANVGQGQAVGLVGSTGNSTGPHIHFSVLVNGEQVDPMQYFGFAVGTRYLPQDMIIQAHKGEMIVPRHENPYANSKGSITGGLSGNGVIEEIRALRDVIKDIKRDVTFYNNYTRADPSPSEIVRSQKAMIKNIGI